jgi:hypothetical protein
VQATNFVFSLNSGLRFSGVSFSSGFGDSHHLTVRLRRLARLSHGFTLVSCSIFERMISEPEGISRAYERFMKSWVVLAPSTAIDYKFDTVCGRNGTTPISDGSALTYLAAAL